MPVLRLLCVALGSFIVLSTPQDWRNPVQDLLMSDVSLPPLAALLLLAVLPEQLESVPLTQERKYATTFLVWL